MKKSKNPKKKTKGAKSTKLRAKHYEKPLKIEGTFKQAIKALVREPKAEVKGEK